VGGANLTKAKKNIAKIGKTALRLEEQITRVRNQTIRGGVIEQARREWWAGVT
jgi:hypothetical protein